MTSVKTTFAELGIPFPLFEAPADDSDYAGSGSCCICGTANRPCFSLGIGTALMIACPGCGTVNGLDVHNKVSVKCRACAASVDFPSTVGIRKEPKTCFACLRAGKAALTKSTESGPIPASLSARRRVSAIPSMLGNIRSPPLLLQEKTHCLHSMNFEICKEHTHG